MENQNAEIVVIDDDLEESDPRLVKLSEEYKIQLFKQSEPALLYLKGKTEMAQKIIVILDVKLSSGDKNGHKVLEDIRNISKLIPVILFTAIDEKQEKFSDFINNHVFGFLPKEADILETLEMVNRAEFFIRTSVDGAIEEWISISEKQRLDEPYLVEMNGKSYTLRDILYEVRNETEFGRDFQKDLLMLTIDLLLKRKTSLK